MIDFKKLHEPYAGDESPSPEMQIKWLQKNGIPAHIVDQAMIKVYDGLETGQLRFEPGKFAGDNGEHSAGFFFDQYLMKTAQEMHQQELTDHVAKLERFHGEMKKKWEDEQKSKKSWFRRVF